MIDPSRRARPRHLLGWAFAGEPGTLIALAGTMLGVAAAELAIPWLLALAVDAAVGARYAQLRAPNLAALNRLGILMLVVIAVLYGVHVLYLRLETRIVFRAIFRLRRLIYSTVLDQPIGYFARAKTGELAHRVQDDPEVLDEHGVYLISDLPFSVLTALGVLALMALMEWRLTLVVVTFLAVATVVSAYFGRSLPTLRKMIQSVEARFSARLQEGLSGIRTVKSFGREQHEVARLDAVGREAIELEIREGRIGALIDPLLELMELLGLVLIVWYGAHLIAVGQMTPGVLVAFIAYMELLSEPVSAAGGFYRNFQACRGVLQRLAEFLDDMRPSHGSVGCPRPEGPLTVRFEQVSFAYPGMTRKAVDRITVETHPGELVAIAGRNGAGKSTLMDLLLDFWRPDEGRILVSSCDLRSWDPNEWRSTIGTMPQDVFLFNASLAENIRYGRLEASRGEIEIAAAAAGLGPLVARLPAGLETVVGDRGQTISGGERQRVSLARILLKDPKIVVFDEPTSGLDGHSVRDLSARLVELARDRTVFVIAHRPETLECATRVILLDAGRVVAVGTHAELLATNASYAELMTAPQHIRRG